MPYRLKRDSQRVTKGGGAVERIIPPVGSTKVNVE
jgi:hypothetical protein